MTIDILICTFNKGIVRVVDIFLPPTANIRYIVSFQYTDERFLALIPDVIQTREDVKLYKYKGKGLSANRNLALEQATADLVLYADDDAHFTPESFSHITKVFEENPSLDVALFQAYSYTGKPLKQYAATELDYTKGGGFLGISALEIVVRRTSVQGKIRFDERFGLGTQFLTCGEEEIWMADARSAGLVMRYFPKKIVETSTMLKGNLVYVDAGVQRSKGAILYYSYGAKAWWLSFSFALQSAMKRMCHFWPMFRNMLEGINYVRRTSR